MFPLVAFDDGSIFLIVFFLAVPLAIFAIAGVGKVYDEVGKGVFTFDQEEMSQLAPPAERALRDDEVRQMLEAKSFRAEERGEAPIDVDAEMRRLLSAPARPSKAEDAMLVEEVRQLVVARNERRLRRGEEELDVESEVARQLEELENLGQ